MKTGRERRTTYLLYSATNTGNLKDQLGLPEYSYYFVREKFRSMLEKRATAIVVTNPEREVDCLYDALSAKGHDCVFLAFCPPHRMPPPMRCPTVPIFAWEFDTIPNEIWGDDLRNDWRTVLSSTGRAITHSRFSAEVIKATMGSKFPAEPIPAPVWDDFQSNEIKPVNRALNDTAMLTLKGRFLDSLHLLQPAEPKRGVLADRLALTASYALAWYHEVLADLLPHAIRRRFAHLLLAARRVIAKRNLRARRRKLHEPSHDGVPIELQGTIFLSVLNPRDTRKNWNDMLTAFCHALGQRADATLILKFVGANCWRYMAEVTRTLAKLPALQCRVIVIDEFLDDERYRQLVCSSTFAVNTSRCEGQCLPLMEAMSCGKPVVSPLHTGMNDYLDGQVGFVVRSSPEMCSWPHDPREALRAHCYRIDWQSLVDAYRDAYRLAKDRPEHYHRMGRAAAARMKEYCSERAVFKKLKGFLQTSALSGAVEKTGIVTTRPLAAVVCAQGGNLFLN